MGFITIKNKNSLKLDHHKKGEKNFLIDALIKATGSAPNTKYILIEDLGKNIRLSAKQFGKSPIKFERSKDFEKVYTAGLEYGIWKSITNIFELSDLSVQYLKIQETLGQEKSIEFLNRQILLNMFRFTKEGEIITIGEILLAEINKHNSINTKIIKEFSLLSDPSLQGASETANILFHIIAKSGFAILENSKTLKPLHSKINDILQSQYFDNLRSAIPKNNGFRTLKASYREIYAEIMSWDFLKPNIKLENVSNWLDVLDQNGHIKGDIFDYVIKTMRSDGINGYLNSGKNSDIKDQLKKIALDDKQLLKLNVGSLYWRKEISVLANNFDSTGGILFSKSENKNYLISKKAKIIDGKLFYAFKKNSQTHQSNNNIKTMPSKIFLEISNKKYVYLGEKTPIEIKGDGVIFQFDELNYNIQRLFYDKPIKNHSLMREVLREEDQLMNDIKLICNNFNINLKELDHHFNHMIHGNFVEKIDILFSESDSSIIKANIKNNKFIFKHFDQNYEIGAKSTWGNIWKGLFFMGLINDRKYTDEKIQEGIIIPELLEFNNLDEYLSSFSSYSKIMLNYKSDSDWFKKIIAGTICAFAIQNNFAHKIFSKTNIEICSNFKSYYRKLFEHLKKISLHKNNVPLTKDEIKELDDFSDKIKNQNKEKIQEALSEKSKEAKKISNLRSQFSKAIELEFDSFMTTQEKDMQNVISEYAKTFDLNIEMTATDKAHIIPVWYLVKEKRWDDIKNPNNGLILDPNTHRLFDKDKKTTLKDNRIFNDYHEFVIDKRFINPERRKFMDEWIENQGQFE